MAERRYSLQSRTAFDRFIPFRPNLDVEASHARLMSRSPDCAGYNPSPGTECYSRLLSETTHAGDGKILPICITPVKNPFKCKMNQLYPTSPDEGYDSPKPNRYRRIPTSPECIMDMPGLRDDFYTNLLDWSNRNLIAVSLFQSTYVWNAESKDCQKIEMHYPSQDYYLSALCWSKSENLLAIADNDGEITVCDVEHMKCRQHFRPFQRKCSVGVLQWTDLGIISGNRKGKITMHDSRCKSGETTKVLTGHHGREVCGLRHETGTYYLASGGDDGTVNIWDLRMMQNCKSINAHTACVKALAWCPWRRGIIATGGGSSDGHIRLWYANTGEKLKETNTGAQICGLLWSEEYMELVSAHGSATPDKNDLVIWDMKKFEFIAEARLRQHLTRPLHIALSPDKTTIASAGADEALCLWNTFPRQSRKQEWTPWDWSPLNMDRYVCDVEHMKCRQHFRPFQRKCSVGVLQWTDLSIISGNRKGKITMHDSRCKSGETTKLLTGHHGREVCGLRHETGTYYLASGGDDGTVNIWDLRMMQNCKSINAHTACVKALAWCPWRRGIIATGGGSSDGHIRLWYANTGEKLKETNTGAQICGLLWSEEYMELVSAHGSATPDKNDLVIWDMKKFEFIAEARLRQHLTRSLHIALSPDKTTIASAGADEALCLWNTFPRQSRKQDWTPWDWSPLNMDRYVR